MYGDRLPRFGEKRAVSVVVVLSLTQCSLVRIVQGQYFIISFLLAKFGRQFPVSGLK